MLITNFLVSTTAPNLNSTAATSTTALALFYPTEKNSINLSCNLRQFFPSGWEASETSLAFLDIKFSISGNVLCTSVHYKPTDSHSYLLYSRHTHHISRTPFLILNFLDFDVYVVMTPIFAANQRRCDSYSKNVAILSLWSKQAITAPNNLIDSQHYKRYKKIRMTEFHSPSLSILIIRQSKVSFFS